MAGGRVVDTLLTKDTHEDEVLGIIIAKRIGGQKV